MSLKNPFLVLIATFFVAGFIFMTLPNEAFSQPDLGCCQNDNSGQCIPGTQTQQQCMDNLPSRTWFPNDPPCVGGGSCASAVPTGCCDSFGPDSCSEDITEAACTSLGGMWEEGASIPCDDGTCGDPLGCCAPDDLVSCQDGVTVNECDTVWTEGESCNGLDPSTCGPAGCCQFDDEGPECRNTNFADCDDAGGTWTSADSCSESGECLSNITGCCVFGKNDCSEISELQCELENGDFKGAGVECSEVPICNIEVSPIPTLNQWGLIAVAGLLGLVSLFIIIRRHRYNVG